MLTREQQVAWAAGLFEGEGCFSRSGNGAYLCAALETTDRDVLLRFHAIVGQGKIYARFDKRPNRKPVHRWQVYGIARVTQVVELFRPYLGERRLARAEQLIEEESAKRLDRLAKVG